MDRRRLITTLLAGGVAAPLAFGSTKLREAIASIDAAPNDEDIWLTVQQAFAVDRTIINLNNGGVSPSPRTVQDAFRRYTEQANQIPSYEMWRHQEPQIESVRTSLADMFGVSAEEIAITRNASESLETAQFGIPMQAGDEVIVSTQDYPRMLTAWEQRARRDGIVIKKVTFDVPVTDLSQVVRAYANAITPKTKVLHCSQVVFLTGQILPVKDVCGLARDRGLISIIDGAHAFAQFPFTHADIGCDIYGTSLHKWLCGPIGTGMLYVKKELIPTVWPLMAAPKEMDANIRKYEEIGTHSAAMHNALIEAIAFNRAIGLQRKADRFRYLHSLWINEVKGMKNVRFNTDISSGNHQVAMVNVGLEGVDPGKLSEWLLAKHRIFTVAITHEQFSGIRVTPNVYTTVDEIRTFGKALKTAATMNIEEFK